MTSLSERALESLTSWIHPFAWTVMKQLVLFLVLIHLFACLEFAFSDANGFSTDCATEARLDADGLLVGRSCWTYRAGVLPLNVTFTSSNALPYGAYGVHERWSLTGFELYFAAFFHTSLQMLNGEVGLGGDPEYMHEYGLVFLASMIGFFWQTLMVASLTAFVEHIGKSGKQYRENVDRLRQYARRQKLPTELIERLFLYYQVRYPDGRYFDDRSVIEDLSRPLQLEVKQQNCSAVLEMLNVTKGSCLAHFLAEHLAYQTFVSNARVVQQGFEPRSMFFILSGTVRVVREEAGRQEQVLCTLSTGQTFGERSLLLKEQVREAVAPHLSQLAAGYTAMPQLSAHSCASCHCSQRPPSSLSIYSRHTSYHRMPLIPFARWSRPSCNR